MGKQTEENLPESVDQESTATGEGMSEPIEGDGGEGEGTNQSPAESDSE